MMSLAGLGFLNSKCQVLTSVDSMQIALRMHFLVWMNGSLAPLPLIDFQDNFEPDGFEALFSVLDIVACREFAQF